MKYPIYNPIAYIFLALVDCCLKIFVRKRRVTCSNLSFGLSSSDSEEFTPQILGFSGEANGQGPFASQKSTRDASKVPEYEGEKPKTQVSKDPEKILICNGAHLGDVILTTALLPVLRNAYPKTKIGMLVGSWSREVVENHPLVDAVHLLDHPMLNREPISRLKKWRRYVQMQKNVLGELKTYSLAIDCCFHFPNCAPLLWKAKIPMRKGFSSAGFGRLLTHALPWDPKENRSAVEAYFSLLQLEKYRDFLRPTLGTKIGQKKERIVIHMGSGDQRKTWPIEKWRALAKRLEGNALVFTGKGSAENDAIEKVIHGVANAQNLCDKLNVSQFVQIIGEAALLIGLDSSAGHIAAAVGTPAVLIFPGIHPQNIWKPYADNVKIVTYPVSCSPCFKGCKTMDCMRLISVEAVYEVVKQLSLPTNFFPLETDRSWITNTCAPMP